ncbi:hypothetical protein DdX_06380 [Ditylenchus destructor]|uniref:Uncharacterized protein n=1 Tax=Ditylenchus destructor TaxID=166010 RepID=A0AAD4N5G8_9BILA|nr:hypothetical protein DdX_06380 [Ditylenchus destructor]
MEGNDEERKPTDKHDSLPKEDSSTVRQRPPRPPQPQRRNVPSTADADPNRPVARSRVVDIGVRNPTWSVTRRQRTETSPSPVRGEGSRSGSRGRDADSEPSTSGETHYRSKTITSTERVQILQMPLELTDVDTEHLRYLTMSPSEASRQVSSTTTILEAGGTPIIAGIGPRGIPTISGTYFNRDCRQTTTIITTTTTTYKILEDEPDSDEFELINLPSEENVGLTVDMPMSIDSTIGQSSSKINFLSSSSTATSSPICSTSEAPSDDISLISAENEEENFLYRTRELVNEDIINEQIANKRDEGVQTSNTPLSNENTSTFSSASPISQKSFSDFEHIEIDDVNQEQKNRKINKYIRLERDITPYVLDYHVNLYHTGISGHKIQDNVEIQQVSTEKPVEKTDTLGRITSLFRKSTAHEDYPPGLQHEGPVSETRRAHEISGSPLDTHASVYHSGRSDEAASVHREPAPAEKPVEKTDTLGRITSLFRKSTAHEDYPHGLLYEGPTTSTHMVNDIDRHPLDHHVSVYHSGRSDEAVPVHHEPAPAEKPVEKTDTLGRITSLFRKSTAHEDYPHGLLYEGPTTSTHMVNDINRHPLDHHVSVYHSGRSDEAVPVHHEPAPAEKPVEKTDTLGRITSLFRKSTAHEDYPHGLLYEGPTTSTYMVNDIDRHPLDHHVSVYHSGRSDEAVPVHHEPAPAEKPDEKTDTLGRITSLFRKSTAHEDYPHGLLYEGPVSETGRSHEISGSPLDTHVSVYHSGRSDEAVPVHHEPAPAEKPVEKTDTLGRITSLFRKSTAHEDYPHGLQHEGPVSETGRSHEISGSPLDTHVSVYHSGRSDEAVPVHREPAPAEKPIEKTDTLGRITSLFRKSTAHEDYPHGLLYEGPTTSTYMEDLMRLYQFTTNRHQLRSQSKRPTHWAESQAYSGRALLTKTILIGLQHEGPVSETGRSHEISGSPLDTHVSVYHSGRSDEAVPVHREPAPAEKPIEKTDTLGRITSLFRKSTAHEDYPHGLLYEGPTTSTHMVNDIDRHPLDHHVSVYHSGRSDEAVPVHHEPAPAEKPVEKTDTLGRITSLFRKSTAHEDYPHGLQHEGPVSEAGRSHEISGSPLDTHVSVYHSGRSDEAVPVHHEPAPAEKPVEKTDTLGRITSLFRKSTAHEDYPHGLQHEGPVSETGRSHEISGSPLDTHVSVYHSGRSDEAVPVHREPAPAEKPIEKTDTLGRITSLFRKSTAHEDYPHGLLYEGPTTSTHMVNDIDRHPLDHHVSVYHSGRSDEAVPVHHEPAPAEKPVEKTDTLGRITSLFRKSTAHEDYPHGLQHEGPVSETGRSHEISGSPLDTHVSVYHSGRSDEAVPVHHEPAPAEKPVEKTDTLGRITSLFRKSTAHEDYPHGLQHEGPVSETGRSHEISGSPLDTHVSVYHSGRSDEAVPVHHEPAPAEKPVEKTDTLGRITSLFRKSTAHEDYPHGLQHEGPVSETGRTHEISGSPLEPTCLYTTQEDLMRLYQFTTNRHQLRSQSKRPTHWAESQAYSGRALLTKTILTDYCMKGLQLRPTWKSTAHEDYPHGLLYEGPQFDPLVNDIPDHLEPRLSIPLRKI